MTIDYKSIWKSIGEESAGRGINAEIARKIPTKGAYTVFLAADTKKKTKILYIKLNKEDKEIDPEKYPRFKGLDIARVKASLADVVNAEFLRFTQNIENTENIFELVISDICENVIITNNYKGLNKTLHETLTKWRNFFENDEFQILSLEKQKGLYGELLFLRDVLLKKYCAFDSISYWCGPDRVSHDFQVDDNAVEIKATASKQHKKFIVSNEKQLDTTGLDSLYLCVYSFDIIFNSLSKTLPYLINVITNEIRSDSIATFHFELKLIKYGYNLNQANKYLNGFNLMKTEVFEVREGFPKILDSDLPNGIGDLHYSVIIAACKPFEIKTKLIDII